MDRHVTWTKARAACLEGGGELASVYDHFEMRDILKYVSDVRWKKSHYDVWIGLNDADKEHYYR